MAQQGIEAVEFGQAMGWAADLARSEYLDRLGARFWAFVDHHPTGLDLELITQRKPNRQQILDCFDAALHHWDNYAWQRDHLLKGADALAALLGRYVEPGRRNIGVVTHIESAVEVTPETAEAVLRLRRQGITVYNQQVFTLQTSRRFQTVANRIAMKAIGVDPYTTFHPKGKEETRDYITPLARLVQERKEEAGLLPRIFRTDEPVFNVPRLGKNHVRAWQDRELIAICPDGRRVYVWHPWEKGITPMNLYQNPATSSLC